MTINFEELKAAITKVQDVKGLELTFEAEGVSVTLRGLQPDEDLEIQKYSQEVLPKDGEEESQAAFAEFMDRVRFSTLGYSIVAIDDLDLREIEYLSTRDESGEEYDIPKHEAVRELVSTSWSRSLLGAVFAKFSELAERIEINASRKVKFDPADLDDEIARLEKRASHLQEVREERTSERSDLVSQSQQAVSNLNAAQMEARASTSREETAKEEPLLEDTSKDSASQSVSDEPFEGRSRQPVYTGQEAPAPPPRPREPQVSTSTSVPQQETSERFPDPLDGHSFMDMSDPDAAIAAEGARQERLYLQQKQREEQRKAERRQQIQNSRASQPSSSPPPKGAVDLNNARAHRGVREALNTQNAVMGQKSQPQIKSSTPKAARLDGKEVYSLGAQTLDRKMEKPTSPSGQIDQAGGEGSANPRFRPTKNSF